MWLILLLVSIRHMQYVAANVTDVVWSVDQLDVWEKSKYFQVHLVLMQRRPRVWFYYCKLTTFLSELKQTIVNWFPSCDHT